MLLELNRYLKILRTKANQFERTDINGIVDESFCAKYFWRCLFSAISLISLYLLKFGFSDNFVSYGSSILSIIIGLFITALVFSFDKFYEKNNTEGANSKSKLWDTQSFNYTKKFTYITGHTIVLSVYTLSLLSISALFNDETSLNILTLKFVTEGIGWNEIKLFILSLFLLLQRFFILYWLIRIMYNTLFIVSSMVQYMTTKIDRE